MTASAKHGLLPPRANRLRIAVVGYSFSAIGGLEIVSRAIADVLAEQGHHVTCVGLHEAGREVRDGMTFVGLAPKSHLHRVIAARLPAWCRSMSVCDELRNADAVIFAHAHAAAAILPSIRGNGRRAWTACWLHGREVWGSLGEQVVGVLQEVDALVAVSGYTAYMVQALLGGSTPHVIHNPVDTEIFCPAADASVIRRGSILTVGRHDPDSWHKGYDVLIEAMSILARERPDLRLQLTITGSGPLLSQHRRLIADRGMGGAVTLAGRVSRRELVDLYRTTDVFAFPSRMERQGDEFFGEGFGVVNVEAAACGRPVVTSTDGGCPETVDDGATGYVVDPRSPAHVAAALARLFDMPAADRDAIGRRGRDRVVAKFSKSCFRHVVADFVENGHAEWTARPANRPRL